MGTTQKRLKPKSSISEEQFWQMLTSGKIGTHVGTVKNYYQKRLRLVLQMLILKHLTIQSLLKKTLVNTIQETIRLQYPATQQIET
jgi:hypothetical protein